MHDGLYGITNLGAVLFAKRLDEFPTVWRKVPRVIIFEGVGKLSTKLDRPETKGYAVGFAGLIDLINSQIKTNEVVGKALRREVKMFPDVAVHGRWDYSWLISRQPIVCSHYGRSQTGQLPTMC